MKFLQSALSLAIASSLLTLPSQSFAETPALGKSSDTPAVNTSANTLTNTTTESDLYLIVVSGDFRQQ
ncbi:MAG: hypothetical protein ACI93V_001176, partial [Alteromonadaceae bacterium]